MKPQWKKRIGRDHVHVIPEWRMTQPSVIEQSTAWPLKKACPDKLDRGQHLLAGLGQRNLAWS